MNSAILRTLFGYKILMIWILVTLFSCQNEKELKTQQYFVEGYNLYQTNCSNCHQENGEGLANLYPAITNSKLLSNDEALARLFKYGTKSKGENHRAMPPNLNLMDIEIAELITFVNIKWGRDSTYTETDLVKRALQN